MARELYAAGPGEVVIGKTSTQGALLNASEELTSMTGRMVAIPDSPSALSVWDARSSGTQVTDLQYPLGTPITTVAPDSRGRVQFYGPDGETGTLWVQDESGSRWAVQPASTADTVTALVADKLDAAGDTMTGPLIVPAPTAAQQVPRLARTPTATGDLGLPGYAGSDTGWRDVGSTLVGGATVGSGDATCRMRRHGTTVHVHMSLNMATVPSNADMLPIPTGFSPVYAYLVTGLYTATTKVQQSYTAGNYLRLVHTDTADNTRLTYRWETGQSWPTSLPGNQYTPPAQWS